MKAIRIKGIGLKGDKVAAYIDVKLSLQCFMKVTLAPRVFLIETVKGLL